MICRGGSAHDLHQQIIFPKISKLRKTQKQQNKKEKNPT
jgi:hypothetical protein